MLHSVRRDNIPILHPKLTLGATICSLLQSSILLISEKQMLFKWGKALIAFRLGFTVRLSNIHGSRALIQTLLIFHNHDLICFFFRKIVNDTRCLDLSSERAGDPSPGWSAAKPGVLRQYKNHRRTEGTGRKIGRNEAVQLRAGLEYLSG